MTANTDWFKAAKWGVFCHYLAPNSNDMTPQKWNEQIDNFDVTGLAKQLNDIKAPYFFITLGQCSGYFLSPNATYDSLVKRDQSRLSKRDIVAELIDALAPYDTRLMVYCPSHAPSHDRKAVEDLDCTPAWDPHRWSLNPGTYIAKPGLDEKLTTFQRNWEAILAEWSKRWGKGVHGWWFDGCYYADTMYRDKEEPNFHSFAAATKTGNPDSLVAFNPGVLTPVITYTDAEDYTAGEVNDALPTTPARWQPPIIDGKVQHAQYHILTFIGTDWCQSPPRYTPALVKEYTHHINQQGGVVTWDVPIQKTGLIPNTFITHLKTLSSELP